MKRIFSVIAIAASVLTGMTLSAQEYPVLIHSHNDYWRPAPFWTAYSAKLYSYEADIYCIDGQLFVAHDRDDIKPENTLEKLYIEPIVSVYKANDGKPWEGAKHGIQLLVDIKNETDPAMAALSEAFGKYPEVFDRSVNPYGVQIAITGNFPKPEDFAKWPKFMGIDGRLDINYTPEQLERVVLISEYFRDFVKWNGKGTMLPDQEKELKAVIEKVHAMGKPIRFWSTPECESTYYTFYNLGIDFVNTDDPATASAFFSDFANKNFQLGSAAAAEGGVTRFANLDKTTRDFAGFQNDKLQLSKGIETYEPVYGKQGKKIKNVIYLIGDGLGLNQATAAYYANNHQLTIFNINDIGFQVNHALGAFTTDSAAAGSALATGECNANRHISATVDGQNIPSLSDFFNEKDYAVGVMTLGNVADATPSAFYGHSTERDNADEITRYLLDGHVDLLCGSGMREFTNRKDGVDLIGDLKKAGYAFISDASEIDDQQGKVICIDERMDKAVEESTMNFLADATKDAIEYLQTQSKKGFFLMVEGAKIDYAGHAKSLPGSILETLSFDLAVAEALKFADENGETLVVVTGDHETGGLVLLDGDEQTSRVMGVYVTNDHTPAMLPVYAYGPGADKFTGIYNNTEIARRIKSMIK